VLKLTLLQRNLGKFVAQNSAALLTGAGVAGVIGTAALSIRAGLKTEQVINDLNQDKVNDTDERVSKTEIAKKVWPLYVPVVAVGSMSIACIIMSNRISAQRAAALAAAYGISQGRFEEYKAKVEEKIGLKKATDVNDSIVKDKMEANPPSREVLILSDSDVLFFDMLTGRYFRSTVQKIESAQNQINEELLDNKYASLTDFYNMIGIDGTTITDELGWNQLTTGLIEVKFTTEKTKDERPCMAMDFAKGPITDYQNHY
jgi:hypothetical protein